MICTFLRSPQHTAMTTSPWLHLRNHKALGTGLGGTLRKRRINRNRDGGVGGSGSSTGRSGASAGSRRSRGSSSLGVDDGEERNEDSGR